MSVILDVSQFARLAPKLDDDRNTFDISVTLDVSHLERLPLKLDE
jgi:hypothetical protein